MDFHAYLFLALLICASLPAALSTSFRPYADEVRLVMFTLLVMTPTVFFAIQRIFDWCDQTRLRFAAWCRDVWAKRPFQKKKKA